MRVGAAVQAIDLLDAGHLQQRVQDVSTERARHARQQDDTRSADVWNGLHAMRVKTGN